LTLDFAKTILDAYQLGQGPATDFLTINCASTDYAGHLFGPNSIEEEDVFLRLDLDLASFFTALDTKLGKGNYLVFLTLIMVLQMLWVIPVKTGFRLIFM